MTAKSSILSPLNHSSSVVELTAAFDKLKSPVSVLAADMEANMQLSHHHDTPVKTPTPCRIFKEDNSNTTRSNGLASSFRKVQDDDHTMDDILSPSCLNKESFIFKAPKATYSNSSSRSSSPTKAAYGTSSPSHRLFNTSPLPLAFTNPSHMISPTPNITTSSFKTSGNLFTKSISPIKMRTPTRGLLHEQRPPLAPRVSSTSALTSSSTFNIIGSNQNTDLSASLPFYNNENSDSAKNNLFSKSRPHWNRRSITDPLSSNPLLVQSSKPSVFMKDTLEHNNTIIATSTVTANSFQNKSLDFPVIKNPILQQRLQEKRPPSASPMKLDTHGTFISQKKSSTSNLFNNTISFNKPTFVTTSHHITQGLTMRRTQSQMILNPVKQQSSNNDCKDKYMKGINALKQHQSAPQLPVPKCINDFKPCLPHFKVDKDTINRISCETMAQVLEGQFKDNYDQLYIIDCRFPYEFVGGHVKNAKNINTAEDLESLFFDLPMTNQRSLIIFHCEFSKQRAPSMALHLRNRDRTLNSEHYPNLYYPDIYVLQGGYKSFFESQIQYCEPQNYIQMENSMFKEQCKVEVTKRKRQFRRCFSESFLG